MKDKTVDIDMVSNLLIFNYLKRRIGKRVGGVLKNGTYISNI